MFLSMYRDDDGRSAASILYCLRRVVRPGESNSCSVVQFQHKPNAPVILPPSICLSHRPAAIVCRRTSGHSDPPVLEWRNGDEAATRAMGLMAVGELNDSVAVRWMMMLRLLMTLHELVALCCSLVVSDCCSQ